jgi:hypothetical protein
LLPETEEAVVEKGDKAVPSADLTTSTTVNIGESVMSIAKVDNEETSNNAARVIFNCRVDI